VIRTQVQAREGVHLLYTSARAQHGLFGLWGSHRIRLPIRLHVVFVAPVPSVQPESVCLHFLCDRSGKQPQAERLIRTLPRNVHRSLNRTHTPQNRFLNQIFLLL
jgi:hypothetical protein